MYTKKKKQLVLTFTICIVLLLNIIFLYLSVQYTVQANYIPVRSTPNEQAALQEIVLKNNHITIVKKQNTWTQIFIDNHTGWVYTADLESSQLDKSQTAVSVKAKNASVSVFKDNRSTDKELGKLDTNTTYLKYHEKNNWSQIVYNDSLAWVESNLITTESEIKTANVQAQYPSVNIAKVKSESSILTDAPGGRTIATLLAGDEIIVSDPKLNNDHYYGNYLGENTDGYISAKDVTYQENVKQRVGKKATQLSNATIVVDPGHGGIDGGAVDSTNRVSEKEVTLKTSLALKKALESKGAKVIMTRESDIDVDLSKRSDIANRHNADLFISIHYDSAEVSGPSGTSVHYLHYEDTRLADLVEAELKKLPLPSNGKKINNFLVLRESKSPALLLELGYMNNTSDVNIFNSDNYRNQVVQSIINALEQYFN